MVEVQEVCCRDTYFHLRMGTDPVPETICSFEMSSHEPPKVPISFILPVCPSACISTVPTGEIFMKFDIRDFYEHLSRNSKFGKIRTKISGPLHAQDLSTFILLTAVQNIF